MAFLQEPRPRREPALRAPLSVLILIAVLIAAHAARAFAPAHVSEEIINRFALVAGLYSQSFLALHHLAQPSLFDLAVPLVSYIFLHANFTHVIVNCLWLLAFGSVVARRFGALWFLVFFLVCGIAAAATHVLSNWGTEDAAVGASGAIAGVMAAGVRMIALQMPLGMRETPQALLPLTAPPVLLFSGLWLATNVAIGLTGFDLGLASGPVAWQAHLGGYFAGLFLAGPFDRLSGQRPLPDQAS